MKDKCDRKKKRGKINNVQLEVNLRVYWIQFRIYGGNLQENVWKSVKKKQKQNYNKNKIPFAFAIEL